jgi:hypothetical protein
MVNKKLWNFCAEPELDVVKGSGGAVLEQVCTCVGKTIETDKNLKYARHRFYKCSTPLGMVPWGPFSF